MDALKFMQIEKAFLDWEYLLRLPGTDLASTVPTMRNADLLPELFDDFPPRAVDPSLDTWCDHAGDQWTLALTEEVLDCIFKMESRCRERFCSRTDRFIQKCTFSVEILEFSGLQHISQVHLDLLRQIGDLPEPAG